MILVSILIFVFFLMFKFRTSSRNQPLDALLAIPTLEARAEAFGLLNATIRSDLQYLVDKVDRIKESSEFAKYIHRDLSGLTQTLDICADAVNNLHKTD